MSNLTDKSVGELYEIRTALLNKLTNPRGPYLPPAARAELIQQQLGISRELLDRGAERSVGGPMSGNTEAAGHILDKLKAAVRRDEPGAAAALSRFQTSMNLPLGMGEESENG